MGAEKVIKINPELEVERLKEKLSLMEEVIDYSVAETVQGLKKQVKDLETEAIKLRAVVDGKDKLIEEKDKRIKLLDSNIEQRAELRAQSKIQELTDDYERQLVNAKSNGSRKVKAENETLKEANKTQQEMYNSLLEQFNKSHENELAIMDMCKEILETVKQLVVNGSTAEEIVKTIDNNVESLQKFSVEEECDIIKNMLDNNYTKKEIASYLYPGLARREQKVQDRINSKTYQKKFGPRP